MIRKVSTRAAIVLTVGWSACAWWFAYLTTPGERTFQLAWSERWTPPEGDLETKVRAIDGWNLVFPSETDPSVIEQVVRDYNAQVDPEVPARAEFSVVTDQPSNQSERALRLAYERVQADLEQHRIAARHEVIAFVWFTAATWLVPIAGVWSIVWIFAPLSGRKQG